MITTYEEEGEDQRTREYCNLTIVGGKYDSSDKEVYYVGYLRGAVIPLIFILRNCVMLEVEFDEHSGDVTAPLTQALVLLQNVTFNLNEEKHTWL